MENRNKYDIQHNSPVNKNGQGQIKLTVVYLERPGTRRKHNERKQIR